MSAVPHANTSTGAGGPAASGAARSAGTDPARPAAPRARRLGRPSWLDLRLVAGVALVLLAVLGGARVVTAAGHTTTVWSIRGDLAAGSVVAPGDLVGVSVHFTGADDAERYLPAGVPLPVGVRLGRAVGAGELLPRAALAAAGPATVALPLDVTTGNVPPGLAAGALVDVWAVPAATAGAAATRQSPAVEVLAGVPVAAVSGSGSFGSTGTTVVTVSIPRDTGVAAVLTGVAGRSVVLLPVSGGVDASTASAAPVAPSVAARATATAGATASAAGR